MCQVVCVRRHEVPAGLTCISGVPHDKIWRSWRAQIWRMQGRSTLSFMIIVQLINYRALITEIILFDTYLMETLAGRNMVMNSSRFPRHSSFCEVLVIKSQIILCFACTETSCRLNKEDISVKR